MKDGYYLSTYIVIDKLANLLFPDTIFRHDQNMSLWKKEGKKVTLVKYWELERYSGLKHHERAVFDKEDAENIINSFLSEVGISLSDVVEVWGTPVISDIRNLNNYFDYDLPVHVIGHLFSGMLLDMDVFKNEEIVGFAVDCGPDSLIDNGVKYERHYAGGYSKNGDLIELFPIISPGPLWAEASYLFKMQEGTLMALASASTCKLIGKKLDFLAIENMGYSQTCREKLTELHNYCQELTNEDIGVKFTGFDNRFSREENIISMIMKEINTLSCKMMEYNIDKFLEHQKLNPQNLYLSITGGFGLNCPINSYLMKKYGFKGYMAPPCVSDTGLSLGLALIKFYCEEKDCDFKLRNASHGYKNAEIDKTINEYSDFIASAEKIDIKKATQDLMNGPLVWIEGGAEMGPRALGCRSLLGDPRNVSTKEVLNQIKQREWWRPVAPIVLYEEMGEWFEEYYESPYMLHTFIVKKEQLAKIPAITHLDNSSRVQTISKNEDLLIVELIREFYAQTGIPIICNTSLNDKGEPIINKLEEAINFALRKQINIIYVDGIRIELMNHHLYNEKKPLSRSLNEKEFEGEAREELLIQENPFQLNQAQICRIFDLFGNKPDFSWKNEKKINMYLKIAERFNGILERKLE